MKPMRQYSVMVASPSDVQNEREIAKNVITKWNERNSDSTGVILKYLGWDELSPQSGPPQDTIAKKLLDKADLLVAVFSATLGTPVSGYESGTVYEIEEHSTAGKQVMIYFSEDALDRHKLDIEQYSRLKTYQTKVFAEKKFLCSAYKTNDDFINRFEKNLNNMVYENFIDSKKSAKPSSIHPVQAQYSLPTGLSVFIFGTNGVGKTTISRELSRKLGVQMLIETNTIRETLRTQDSLFKAAGEKNPNFNEMYELIEDSAIDLDSHIEYEKQCHILAPTIAKVSNYHKDNFGSIVEGINIIPKYVLDIPALVGAAVFIMLEIPNKDTLLLRLKNKAGKQTGLRAKYVDKIDSIYNLQQSIKKHTKEHAGHNDYVFIVDNSSSKKQTVEEIIEILKQYNEKI